MTIPKPLTQKGLTFKFAFSHWGLYVSKITNDKGQIFIHFIGDEKFFWCTDRKCYVSTETQHQLFYEQVL